MADYTALLAEALGRSGVEVHVWSPAARHGGEARPAAPGVMVHRWPGGFGPAELRGLGAALDAFAPPRRVLVEYTPYAWGRRGMNLGFGRWLRRRSRAGDQVRCLIHEPFYPWRLRDRPTRWVLAAAQRRMLRDVLAASATVDVTIPAWEACARRYDPLGPRAMGCLPVPSTIPVVDDPAAVAALRSRIAPRGEAILGCFSTYGPLLGPVLRAVWPALLRDRPDRVGLWIGRGAAGFAAPLELGQGGVVAVEGVSARDVSLHLQACDLMVLPYPDGISGRRTTAMAALAHGRAIVSNLGPLSEAFWRDCDAVAIVSAIEAIPGRAEDLLRDRTLLAGLGDRARGLHDARFDVGHTVAALVAD